MKTKKQLNLALILFYISIIVLQGLILSPLYVNLSSDVLTNRTILPEIIYYINRFFSFISYPIVFSLLIYSVYKFSLNGNKAALIIPVIGSILRYLFNLLMDLITEGLGAYQPLMLISFIVYSVIDIFQLILLALVAERLITVRIEANRLKKKAATALGEHYEEKTYLPFSSIVDRSNPVIVSAFIGSALIAGFQIIARIRYDIDAGVSDIKDVIDMVLYYSLDIATVFIAFLIIVFLLLSYIPKNKNELQ